MPSGMLVMCHVVTSSAPGSSAAGPTEETLCSGIDVGQQTLSIDGVKPFAHVSHNQTD